MVGPFEIAHLRQRISELMARKGIKPTTLSLRVGKSPSLVKDLLEKTEDAKLSTIYKLAEALGVLPSDLLDGELTPLTIGPQLNVKGAVSAGDWCEAFERPQDEWQTLTGRADVTADLRHRFFLEVRGDSMNLLYPDSSYIECVSLFGRAEAAPGKKVVVLRHRADGLVEATVKELVEIEGNLWLAPKSTNPTHQAFRLDEPGEGIIEVKIIAIVVSSVRPE